MCSGSDIDCFKIVEFISSHNSSSIAVKVGSSISETDSSIQYWGLKDFIVSVRTCHSSCLTCTGPTLSECLSCEAEFYLHGNVCVHSCNNEYAIPDLRKCSSFCPSGYYPSPLSKTCLQCEEGCLSCDDGATCTLWSDGRSTKTLWEEHLLLWVVLILIGCMIVFFIFWKCVIKRYIDKKIPNEVSEDLKKNMIDNEQVKDTEKEGKQSEKSENIANNKVSPNDYSSQNVTESKIAVNADQVSSNYLNPSWSE